MSGLPEGLQEYLAARDKKRGDTVLAMLGNLTERELALVSEAAVMGWVQGARHHDLPIPKSSKITAVVLDATTAFEDLYPTLAALNPAYVPPEPEEN